MNNNQNTCMICPRCGLYVKRGTASCERCGYVFKDFNVSQRQVRPQPQVQSQQQMRPQSQIPPQQVRQQPQIPPYPPYPTVAKQKTSVISYIILALLIAVVLLVLIVDYIKNGQNDVQQDMNQASTEINDVVEDATPTTEESVVELPYQTIYDDRDVKIDITGYENNNVCFYIENNSDKNYDFDMHSFAINGIMTNNNIYEMSCSVSSKSKANCKLDIASNYPAYCDGDIQNFDFHIWVYDVDTLMKDFDCGVIHVSVKGDKKNNTFVSGKTVLEQDGLKFDLIELNSKSIVMAVTNTNDYLVEVDTKNVTINDWSLDTSYDFDSQDLQVLPNCQNVYTLKIDDEFLSENNIDTISKITLNYAVRPNADYFKEYDTNKIEITN